MAIFSIPDIWNPIDAGVMCPTYFICFSYYSFKILTENAFNIIRLNTIILSVLASLAQPLVLWNHITYISTIATLMYRRVTSITDNYLIVIQGFFAQTNVTLDVIIFVVLKNPSWLINVFTRKKWVDYHSVGWICKLTHSIRFNLFFFEIWF